MFAAQPDRPPKLPKLSLFGGKPLLGLAALAKSLRPDALLNGRREGGDALVSETLHLGFFI